MVVQGGGAGSYWRGTAGSLVWPVVSCTLPWDLSGTSLETLEFKLIPSQLEGCLRDRGPQDPDMWFEDTPRIRAMSLPVLLAGTARFHPDQYF